MTIPVFIVGSGRCGTKLIYRLLREYPNVTSHHEYQIHIVQPVSCMWAMGLISNAEVREKVNIIYGPAVHYESSDMWINSCNKASWIITQISKVFPNAKFIHLIRDGRRVVSSFYNKLGHECYADRDVQVLKNWVEGVDSVVPPNEKRYWWPTLPDFTSDLTQWERLCWHWAAVNSAITAQLCRLAKQRRIIIRLEDFVSDHNIFRSLFDFLGLSYYQDLFDEAQAPVNVREAKSYELTYEQEDLFKTICGGTMIQFGYTGFDYTVNYENSEPARRPIYSY